MTRAQIIATQKRVGATPDGFWGPKSIAACQQYLRRLMPSTNPWPASDQASLTKFYGAPGDESQLVNLPAPVPLRYEGRLIKTIRVHRKCSASLGRALDAAYKVAPEIVSIYDGCYNNRPMRAGTLPSLHARGAAIDLDAARLIFNAAVLSNPAPADHYIDMAAIAGMGAAGDETNATNYIDLVHPTAVGNALIAAKADAVLP